MTTNPTAPVFEAPPSEAQPAVALEDLRALVAAAARAPSGDNVQPWHFEVHATDACICVYADSTRDGSPMNSGQRMSLLTCGAAIENALILAAERGWNAKLELADELPDRTAPRPLVARVRLVSRQPRSLSEHSAKLIAARVTNRRHYDGRAIDPYILSALQDATPERTAVSTHWICDRGAINAFAGIVARGDALMFNEHSIRQAILANIRFDLPPTAEAAEGLPLAALEASLSERLALRSLRRIPNAIFKHAGMSALFSSHARSLVRSASGLCVITLDANIKHAEVRIGQSLQRAWLALTELGLAVQPMMSLMVIENALRHGTPELIASLGSARCEALLNKLGATLKKEDICGAPRFLLRFGYAAPPSGRTGRREDPKR